MILLHYDVLTIVLLTIASVQAFSISNKSDATSRSKIRKFDLTQSSANFYRINDAIDGPNVNNIKTYFSALEDTQPNLVSYLLDQDEIQGSQKKAETNADETADNRLPTSVVPDRYVVTLIPNLDDGNFTFVGTVEITLNVTNATNSITVHANDLEIDDESVSVRRLTDEVDLVVLGLSPDTGRHFFTVTVAESLVVGQQYRLRINYTGHLREDMGGFYRSYYYVGDEKRWLASTQFQSTSARRAFPCFDEPAFKAKFKISIARTEDRHALSNMPVASSVYDQNLNLIWDHFEETPMPMSSYLVAFVVSDFVSLNASDGMFRTWQRASALSQANYSIEISPDVLKALENFTGVEYFLPKLDQVAVPDFSAGAMENWGIVTYREQNILFEYGVSTSANKQRIAEVIAHELAHKWFGNLVSPKWWNYLWLSEGFATYFQYFAMHKVDPKMRLDHQFLFLHHHTAFQTDSLESSHPMTNSPTGSSITQIVYNKAGSVIRMMEHILTTEIFRKGLNRYLTERYNSIAEADDLFSALNVQNIEDTPTPQIDVKTVMDTWTLQKGYPVVTVNRNYTTGSAIVSQKRFLLRNNEAEADTSNSRWWVPLTFTSQADQDFLSTAPKIWMNDSQTDTTIEDIGARANQWVIFNIQETGFYRVNYDAQNWAFLASYLNSENFTNIHVLNRAQLLDDAFNLARAGVLSYRTALETTKYLSRETDYIPWYAALTGISYLDKRIRGLGEYEHLAFRNYILELLSDLQKTIGFEEQTSDDHTMKLLRNLVLTWSCDYGNRDCISWSIDTFATAMSEGNTSSIPPDVKTVVYCNALRQGGEAEWDFLWEQYLTSEVSTEQALILGVLGCTTNETVAHKYLRKTITEDSYIRAQDNSRIYPSVYNNPYGVDFAINFLANNYKEILEFNNNAVSSITNLVSGIASAISSQDQLDKLRSFFTSISEDLGESGLATAEANLQSALRNLAWLEENGGVISTWVKEQDYRLPRDIVPDYYVVKLTSDLDGDTFTYDGSVDITLNVSVDTSHIILHANDLEMINTIVRKVEDEESIVITATNLDTLRDFYYIQLEENLVAGEQYILSIVFQGHHREDMYGFYRSYYYNETGDKSWIASTQFQATSARRAFPCFDEPGFKARFKISIARTEDRHARSNMPLLTSDEINDAGLIWDHFQETPMPISTYLIAFVVSDFVNLSSSDGFYSTWQRAGAVYQAQYSIDVSPLIMKSLENFTELDYFLPKIDQVAVPDFSAGAMENWGLVTYREQYILHEEGVSTSINKQNVATIIAHEFAHKWFGNLVSPTWWRYTWLNEGFARYFEFFTTHTVETTWRMEDQFVVRQVHTSLSSDSLESAHALSADVGSPNSVSSIFSTITYNKGASVIRMMEHFMTHETFRKGLSSYLSTYGNRTAEPDDLFASLDSQYFQDFPNRPVSVKTVMDTWTLQSGHPVITITRNYISGALTVTQERFYLRRSGDSTDTHDYKWWVPLTYTSNTNRDFLSTTTRTWMNSASSQITINNLGASANDWVIFNIQQIGFYRVNYDAQNWALLANYLNSDSFTNIHVLNRAQLLDDAFNLARAGNLDYTTALEITKYLSRETDYIPWFSALTGFTYLDRRFRGYGEYNYTVFKSYLVGLLSTTYQTLSLEEGADDDHTTKLNRNLILTWLCNYGVEDCTNMAKSEFNKLLLDSDYRVTPDLKTVVYCNALRYGGEEEWNFLWNRYLTHNVNTEQVLILGVLGCTRNETLAHGYLAKTINSDSGIRTQDLSTVSSSVYNNPYGVDFAISFLSQNYRQMIYFNNSTSTVTSLISNIAGVLSTQAQLNELRSFITNNSAELGTSVTATALNSLQTAQNNLDWLAEHGTTITNWLKSRRYRLPTDILPDRYVIELIPYIDNDNFTFNGRVEIFLDVAVATNAIRLHANDLDINATSVTVDPVVADGTIVKPTIQSQVYSEDLQIYTIILSDNLVVGEQYKLSISFLGHLRSDMQGFYRSYYDVEGERRWLASTQFQATHARRAFPCFDEPGFKSKFKISIARTEDRHALSNMPVESSIPDPALGLTWDHFEETPMPMSSYLVAFVVSDFVALNRTLEDTGVVYRNWQRAAAINQSMYSIDISPRIMTYLDNFTGIPYFLPKVDQVAVPDFSAGAMENWGLVTYRERNILHEVGVASAENKQRTADIISHEFAHKWFGNLVSPKWWGHLWLNEGFARYFQYFATAQVETDWRYGEQFVVRQVHQALSSDSLESSHPMTHEVSTPSEAWGMFSTISYAKGASVIRMAEHFLGSTAFQNGLQEYLSNHGNQTTEPDYLFNVLQSHATGIDVKAILDTWTLQKNYPVITVTRNYGTGGVTVRQERFLLRRSGVLDNHVYRWYVPLTYTTQTQLDFNTTSTKQWLPDFSTQATIGETVSANQWILFNIQQTGFYRVNYDAQNWALLANYLNSDSFTNIHVLNRAQLLDDAFNLARAGSLDYTTALEITKYLSRETDYIPWYSALSSLSYLNNRLRGASEYDYYVFKNYLKVLLGRVYTEVGLEVQTSDGHVTKLLRNSISTWACDLGDQTCIDFSRRELAAYIADPENYLVDPDVKSVVFCNGLRYGGEEEWNFLWGQYLKSEVSTEQVLILGILGCTNTESLAHRYLNLTITEDAGIRTQDIALVAPSVYNNPAGVDFAINYLFSHYQDIANYNGGSYSSVISLISGIGGALSSQNQYQRLRDFIEEAGLGASAWNALATAERNLLWLETNGPSITAWLRSQNYRLPETIVPDTYSIKLIPYLEGDVFTFDGEVLILVNVTTATNRITLHVNDLEIDDANVSVRPLDSAENLTLGVITRDEPRHFLDISVPAGLTAGQQYEVNIQYQGYMRDDMFGFYRSYYYVRGEKRWLGTTQFQPTHARRAFPSFDEPSFKAKFKMSIARPANYHALFNTRKIEQEIPEQTEDGRIWDHFEETPYMSTYLIAFVVSDFDNVTNAAGNVTIWQREEASPQASYALSISQPTVTAMERLIGHDYQLPKLDKVAIPDFSAGAMENWGIVTYRERLILWDEIVSTTSNKQTIATIVAHEIAHKWFGNLVTLQWWKYAWLNEGFATYFETFATALVEPDWRLEEQFVLMDHQSALSSDALETSRPMMYDVDTPSEIWSVFDFVNYAKAGTVIRMMEHFLTRDTFLKGLHTYLANHGYSNSEPDNLFAALQEQLLLDSPDADLNVKTVMDTWINQMGYPVVTVTRNYSSASASVSQERFLIQRNPDSTDSHDYKWWIPLSYTRKTGAQFNVTTPSRWLQANESQIVIENIAESSDWIIFNLQESAYYRVNYDANNWNSLISQLNSEDYTVIPPVNRAQLLDDSLNLARAGILDYATALSVTSYLSKESDYIPWSSAFTAFTLLDRRLKGTSDEDYQLFKNYVLNLIGDLYNTLGFDEKPTDHHLDKFLRSNVLTWACNLGLEDCINRSKEELAKQMSNASYNILADVSSTVYCNALRHGGHNEWNHLWARYMSSNVGTEQVLLLNVLGCSNNEQIINSYLSLSITPDSGIRSQDASSVFVAVYSNPAGVDLAFNFLRDNYQSISEFYGGMGSIGNILTGIAARLSTREQADALREFVEENQNNLGTALGASRRALETVEENLVWLGQNGEDIFNWLRDVSPTTSSTESTNTTSTGTTSTGTTSTTTTSTSTTTEPTVTEPIAPDTTTQGDGANSFTGSFCIILFSLLLTYTRFV